MNQEIINKVKELSESIAKSSESLSKQVHSLETMSQFSQQGDNFFIHALTVFILACFVGYYVVWKVTPALHTPLMSITNAISGIIVVGAMIASGIGGFDSPQVLGLIAVIIASVNIFGGFVVTYRMLAMFKKKETVAGSKSK